MKPSLRLRAAILSLALVVALLCAWQLAVSGRTSTAQMDPAYAALTQPLDRFFRASREVFFGRDPSLAQRDWPMPDLVATARRPAAAERAANAGGHS